jgi:nicotinamide-nucleotide amidase
VIKEFSVSEAVASAMASRTRQIMNTDYAIATTGNAGPTKEMITPKSGLFFAFTPNDIVCYNFTNP